MDAEPSSWTNLYLQPNPGTILVLILPALEPKHLAPWFVGNKGTIEWASLLVGFGPIEVGCRCHGLAGEGGSQVHDTDDGFHAGEGAEGTTTLLDIEAVMVSIT
uniref:Uncharacterized protein n=1 Tax=Oryza punctata TaxID=4537 RepID=A0A0E0L268_ORYPU